ncbi:MAG: hypothetical protein JXA92_06370, partial [candidate division Zixibacteria bacterium]|nr:hypothetical protein [candidate division Zixibacteria bacterium]
MKKNIIRLVLPGLVLLSILSGCEEKDVPYVVDSDEIRRYMAEQDLARQLFRTESMIVGDPYTMPYDSATYFDSVIGVERIQYDVSLPGDDGKGIIRFDTISVNPLKIDTVTGWITGDYDNLGFLREAWVEIQDKITVRTLRVHDGDTLQEIVTDRRLYRYGFFLKIGSDAAPYLGWKLWGYNSVGSGTLPVRVTVEDSHSNLYPGDQDMYTESPKSIDYFGSFDQSRPFVRLDQLIPVDEGSHLIIRTQTYDPSIPVRRIPFISAADDDGFFTRLMTYDGVT